MLRFLFDLCLPAVRLPYGPELHITIVDTKGTDVLQRNKIQHAWGPMSLEFIGDMAAKHPWKCHPKDSFFFSDNLLDMKQWFPLHRCYKQVKDAEEERNKRYDWLLRTRTDLVTLERLPLDKLTVDHAYVPRGGYAPFPETMCENDHLFLCPRNLCRSYFELLELWSSPLCTRDPSKARESIFAKTDGFDGSLVMSPAPSQPFLLPKLNRSNVQGHFVARYNTHDKHCNARTDDSSCCGLIREFDYRYTIARGFEGAGVLECEYTLVAGYRTTEFLRLKENKDARAACHEQNKDYASKLDVDQALTLCSQLPHTGHRRTKLSGIPHIDRSSACFEATGCGVPKCDYKGTFGAGGSWQCAYHPSRSTAAMCGASHE